MSDRMTLDHIDTLTADNRDLTTRIVGLEAERDHHRAGLVRVRAEANAALARAAELEAALRALVEAMHTCDGADGNGGCNRVALRGMFGDDFRLACDEHADDMSEIIYGPQLRAALLLLAKGG